MKTFRSTSIVLWAAFAIGMGVASPSQAGLLPVNVTVSQDGRNYRYSYGVVLTSDSILRTNDFFTIYDFQGLVTSSSAEPAGFAFTTTKIGPTPIGTVPTDDPNVDNITWTYTGPDTLVGQTGLGNFMVQSAYGSTIDGVFASRTHRQVDGKTDSNITETEVPVPSPGVPEPATLALMGIGLPLLGLCRFMRRSV